MNPDIVLSPLTSVSLQIRGVFEAIGGCLMAIVNGIGGILQAIIAAIVAVFDIIIGFLTCRSCRGGGMRSKGGGSAV